MRLSQNISISISNTIWRFTKYVDTKQYIIYVYNLLFIQNGLIPQLFLSFHFPFHRNFFFFIFHKVRIVYTYSYNYIYVICTRVFYVYVYSSACAFIYIQIAVTSRCFSYSSFFSFFLLLSYTCTAVLEYVLLHILDIMKFHEIHCEKYSERRDE